MKNIHLIPTPNPSRLLKTIPKGNLLLAKENIVGSHWENQNIYITSDEEIKEGDWYLGFETNYSTEPKERWVLYNCVSKPNGDYSEKIILTTDQDLIKDGVQPIDDDFLEWFIKNPSCEEVELDSICKCISCGSSVKSSCDYAYKCNPQIFYKIIIPKEEPKQIKCYCGHTTYCDCSPLEEPKQETLEEASWKFNPLKKLDGEFLRHAFKEGAKWQQERMFSKEDIENIWNEFVKELPPINNGSSSDLLDYIKRFKKK